MQNNRLWVWGYVMKDVPGNVMFVPRPAWCSLETGAKYLGADNIVFMDSCTSMENLNDDLFRYAAGFKQVVCGLEHWKYAEAARAVSEFSLTHPNVTGAVIDDFLDYSGDYYRGPSAGMTPEELKDVRDALRSANPALKLYVVRYTRQDPAELVPYLPYFDVLNLWVWRGSEDYWDNEYRDAIARLLVLYPGKEILQGLFVQEYGKEDDWNVPVSPELMRIQCRRVWYELRTEHIDGWCILQNGWFGRESHRETMQVLKADLDFYYGTTTLRSW